MGERCPLTGCAAALKLRGTARVTRGEETFLVSENGSTYIPIGTRHRLGDSGKVPLETIEIWRQHYNHHRPHSSLGHLTPNEFAMQGQEPD